MKRTIDEICVAARKASMELAAASTAQKNRALSEMADTLRKNSASILAANAEDLAAADKTGIGSALRDRLALNEKRIEDMASALDELCLLADPIGSGERTTRPNGLEITKIHVPLGVVAIIYEARPNVTADAAGLCLKSGNAVILRGGKEAINSNRAITETLRGAAEKAGLPADAVCFVDDPTREGSEQIMRARGKIDLLIPRGGRGLIKSVVENAAVPVIETGAGNCHLYIDRAADIDMAVEIAVNAKFSRPSVCNSIETMLVHSDVADIFLKKFASRITSLHPLEIRGDERCREILPAAGMATDEDYDTEYDDYILAVKVVKSTEEAVAHIRRYTTGHSEAIVTSDRGTARFFVRSIDAAAVYVNASTRFTDGGEFGLGAEMGISTQRLHARGPMGLSELTTIKYIIEGDGQIR